jgi:glycosyltransferase involved in cell wall biosynthesis
MTVAGICICKDEADIIRITIEHMLTQVDRVYVLDNMSTDGTTDILRYLFAEHRGRMFWGIDKEPAYYQSRKMTELAHRVHDLDQSIDWIVPFDADEIWTSGWAPRLADRLQVLGSHWRGYGQILESSGEQALIDNVFRPYFYEPDPFNVPADHRQLIHDPAILGAQDHVGHE